MSSPEATLPASAGSLRRAALAPATRVIAGCAALVLALWAVFRSPSIGYDTYYALIWGRQLTHGDLPAYDVPHGPTPHPLANLLGAALTPLGIDGALVAVRVLCVVCFAVLCVVCFGLGRRLYSAAVGLAFAGLVVTRPVLLGTSLTSTIDLPFMCLVLGALLVAVSSDRARLSVLGLLGAAGLLRPEAWLFSAAFIAWRWRASTTRERTLMVAVAAVAPVVWIVSDAVITGEPLYSFSRTRAIAENTGEQRGGLLETFSWAARSWKGIVHVVPGIVAIGGLLAGLRYLRSRTLPGAVLLVLGSVSFVATGFSGLPLLVRYFLLPGVLFCLFAAVGAFGWRLLPASGTVRRRWSVASAVAIAAFVVSVPWEVRSIDRLASRHDASVRRERDLQRIVAVPAVEAAVRRCPRVETREFRARPELLYLYSKRDRPPTIVASKFLVVRNGLLLRYSGEKEAPGSASGFRRIAQNATWTALERCAPSPAVSAGAAPAG